MWFKCLDEEGDYLSVIDNSPKNLLISEYTAYTPEGVNYGWLEFNTIHEAMYHFRIILKEKE